MFEGNTGDPKTFLPQVVKVQEQFGIKRFVMVGDRGMITQRQVDALQDFEGIDWIGCRSDIYNGVNNLQAHYRWYVTDCF